MELPEKIKERLIKVAISKTTENIDYTFYLDPVEDRWWQERENSDDYYIITINNLLTYFERRELYLVKIKWLLK